MEGKIFINGTIGQFDDEPVYTDLVDVVGQVKQQKDATSFRVYINSQGGYVGTGYDIYDYLKSLKVPITTIGNGIVASIATVIYMAGDTRLMREGSKFMLHLPMATKIEGLTADEMDEFSKEIRKEENKLVDFYAGNFDIPTETIKPLLKKDLWLNEEQLLNLGIITAQPLKLTAKAAIKTNHKNEPLTNNKKMSKQESKEVAFWKSVKALFQKEGIMNKVLYTAENAEVNFPDVEDDANIAVGDTATIDGQAAEGEVLMQDGRTVVFAAGEVTEIREPEETETEEQTEEEIAKAQEVIDDLKKQLEESGYAFAKLEKEHKETKEQLKAKNNIINKIKALESEVEVDNKKEKPKNKMEEPKGSTFSSAIAKLKTKNQNLN